MTRREPIVVGIMYPEKWEDRPRVELDADLVRVAGLDGRIEIVEVRYVEPDDLRTKRGTNPETDFRSEAPTLSTEQRAAFERVEIALAQDLPFDIGSVAPRLRWVQGMGAGVSQLVSAGLGRAGVRLTSAAGVNAVSIAEFVMARLLQVWKRLPEIEAAQQTRSWQPFYGREIAGSRLGVVGLGAIGRRVAVAGRGLGLEVVGTRRSARRGAQDPDVSRLYPAADLHHMLDDCDAVVSAIPESPETLGLFDAQAFARMKPSSIFCNVGRGSAVDEDALVASLRSEHLSAAILDVVREEPLSPEAILWNAPSLHLSAHCATSPDRFWSNLYALFRENLGRYLSGATLHNETVLS